MEPRIDVISEKKIIGMKIIMSFADNKTVHLWRSFMPRLKEIKNNIGSDLYSIEVYNPSFFRSFNPKAEFEEWAGIEVTDFENVPVGMHPITIPEGIYAVFVHKGPASAGMKTYQYIFETWLPNSVYLLDDRPHFALMGEKYKHEEHDSEEEIWIPIKNKE